MRHVRQHRWIIIAAVAAFTTMVIIFVGHAHIVNTDVSPLAVVEAAPRHQAPTPPNPEGDVWIDLFGSEAGPAIDTPRHSQISPVPSVTSSGPLAFAVHIIEPSFLNPQSVHAIDLDSDGDLDVLATARDADEIAWWENDGNEQFTRHAIDQSFDGAKLAYGVDLDSDGDVDVIGGASYADEIAWWENDGAESFDKHTIDSSFDIPFNLSATDLDSDGDMDVLGSSPGWDEDGIAWWENDGAQQFTRHRIDPSVSRATCVSGVDLDSDGDMDVVASENGGAIFWYENGGTQEFARHTIDPDFQTNSSLHPVDMDSDGDMDVVGTAVNMGIGQRDEVVWWENDGNQQFTKRVIDASVSWMRSAYATDIDGDGDVDVLGGADAGNEDLAWWENDGDQQFTKHVIDPFTYWVSDVYAIDLDGDSDVDVLNVSRYWNEVAWYENKELVDLQIDSIAPLQVLEGQDLVLDKSTAVRVVVRRTGTDELSDVGVKIAYDGHDYTTFYVSEPGNWDSNFVLEQPSTSYPLNFATDEVTKTVYFFDEGLTPASTGAYQISGTVDYEDFIPEPDEENNSGISAPVQIHDTNWTGILFPDLLIKYFRSDWGSAPLLVLDDYYSGSRALIQSAYPVSEEDFQTTVTELWEGDSTNYRGPDGRLDHGEFVDWRKDLSRFARLSAPTADRFISVMPENWFRDYLTPTVDAIGVFNPGIPTLALVEARTDVQGTARYANALHELGHSYGLRLGCEEYDPCNDPDRVDGIGNPVHGGLWVEQRRLMEYSAQHPVYCFMGAISHATYWVDDEDYFALLDDHNGDLAVAEPARASTNEAVLVAGTVFTTGTVELDDWYSLPEAVPDDLPPGEHSLHYLDAGDVLLYEHPFAISFTFEGISTTVAPFVFTAPHVPGTARVIVHHGTTDLAEKIVTENAPAITILTPNGGELLLSHTTIEWSASDGDGDPLSYAILYSRDGGSEWNTLAIDFDATIYEWDLSGLPRSPDCLVKVLATDGFNTGQDISDGSFTVQGGEQALLPLVMNDY